MSGDDCAEVRLLVQADVDGQLEPAEAARVAVHLESCAGCAALQAELLEVTQRLRSQAPYHPAPAALRSAIQAQLAGMAATATAKRPWHRLRTPRGAAVPFGAGLVLAACIALAVLLPRDDGLASAVVADHIRALQPGHLMDVVSTDQHTVKPWFDGRLDFAPPVKDLRSVGFPLAGGRLDYLAGRPVAALVYQRDKHLIDLYVWPDDGRLARGPADGSRNGYDFKRWSQNGMVFWAVSDLNGAELSDFVRLWKGL